MRKFTIFVLFVGFVGSLSAQAGQKEMAGATEKDMMKPMMVTGCVAQSGAMYKLDHAMMSADMKNADMKSTSSADMKSKHMMSYNLMGGDLKAHVGHKVEVTGTMAKDAMSKDAMSKDMAKDKMPNDAMHKDASMMMGGTLQVKSVKMISSTCP
ncbi:MAG: hypothetical protein ABIS29_19510 [Vicinamibacterales bacterium]